MTSQRLLGLTLATTGVRISPNVDEVAGVEVERAQPGMLRRHKVFSWVGSRPLLSKFLIIRKTVKSDRAVDLITLIATLTSERCALVNHADAYNTRNVVGLYPAVIATYD